MPAKPILAAPLALALALATPGSVAAQAATVYRCADAGGQVTYQQEPCGTGTKGRAVEILPDNGLARDSATLESQWSAAAKQGVVSLGMPRRYVRDALGTPAETRQGLAVERATEVWTYRYGDGARRIGFLDGRVTWDRAGDGNTLPVQPSVPRPAPVPAPGVQQDATGMIVMRRPDALPPDGSGAGQPTVRVLPLPSQAGAPPPAAPAQQAMAPLSSTASTWSPSGSAQGALPPAGSPGAAPPTGSSMPAGRSDAMMMARQSIKPGTSCAAVLAQAGTPDRTDTVRVPAPGGGDVPAARHSYAADGSVPPRDVVFTCVGGIVREVERGVR